MDAFGWEQIGDIRSITTSSYPSNKENNLFIEGMIYIARAQDFPHKRPFPVLDYLNAEIEEWGSTNLVIPLARIKVQSDDFHYLSQVQFYL